MIRINHSLAYTELQVPPAAELFWLTANNQYYATLIRAAAALWPHMFNHIYSAGNCEGNEASQPEGTVLWEI